MENEIDVYDLNKKMEDCIVKEQFHQFDGTQACAYTITTDEGLTVVGTHVDVCGVKDWSSARERARSNALDELRKIMFTIINMNKLHEMRPPQPPNNLRSKLTEIIKGEPPVA